MWLFGKRYASSSLGSMDFYDQLPRFEKLMLHNMIERIKVAPDFIVRLESNELPVDKELKRQIHNKIKIGIPIRRKDPRF